MVSDGPYSHSTPCVSCVSWHWFEKKTRIFSTYSISSWFGWDITNECIELQFKIAQSCKHSEHHFDRSGSVQNNIFTLLQCEVFEYEKIKTFTQAWSFTFGLQIRDISSQGQKQDLGKNVYSYIFFLLLTGLKVIKIKVCLSMSFCELVCRPGRSLCVLSFAQCDAQSSALCHYLQKYPVKLNSSNGHNKLSNKILSNLNDCYVKVAWDQEEWNHHYSFLKGLFLLVKLYSPLLSPEL